MGGTIQMIPAKGEAAKIKAILKEEAYVCPEMKKGEHLGDFWVDWYGNRLELGYTFGGGFGFGEWAKAVAQEICRRFKIKKAGWDSVGYCDMKEFMMYRPMEIVTKNMSKTFDKERKILIRQGKWMEIQAKKIFEINKGLYGSR